MIAETGTAVAAGSGVWGNVVAGISRALAAIGFQYFAKKLLEKKERSSYENQLSNFHTAICAFQLGIADFGVALSVRHKRIRIELDKDQDTPAKIKRKLSAIETAILKFDEYVDEYNKFAIDTAVTGVKDYYKAIQRRPRCMPRVCIKTVNGEMVTESYRIEFEKTGIEVNTVENTAFNTIAKGAHFHIENDIPRSAQRADNPHKNSRLRKPRHWIDYKPPGKFKLWQQSRDTEQPYCDKKWRASWIDSDAQELQYESFYKSTLVVPMTMRGGTDSMKPETAKKLIHDNKTDEKRSKLLYGYLCIDHVTTGFFETTKTKNTNYSKDVDVAIMFADLASIAFVYTRFLTVSSATYQEARKYLSDTDLPRYKEFCTKKGEDV